MEGAEKTAHQTLEPVVLEAPYNHTGSKSSLKLENKYYNRDRQGYI
jgi:hypothetical protein